MAQLDQVDFMLFLESDGVKDRGRVCQKLHEHGVTTLSKVAELSEGTLREWGITDYHMYMYGSLSRHARRLLRDSSHDLAAIRQQLLVRARMHCMCVCTIAE